MKSGSIRTLILEKQEYYQQKIPELAAEASTELAHVNRMLANLDKKSPNYYHDRAEWRERAKQLQRDLEEYRRRSEERLFYQRIRHLVRSETNKTNDKHKPLRSLRQRFLLQCFPNMTAAVTIPSDVCLHCATSCIVKRNIARLQCIACGLTRRIITNLTGSNNQHQLPHSLAQHHAPTPTTASSSSSSKSSSNKVHSLQRHEHIRMKWLLKQLQQYRIGSRKVPKDIIFQVARRLRSVHLKSVSVVKHTITRSILKSLDKNEWTSQSSKIADVCNGTPVASFTNEQFLIVIKRLLAVQQVYIALKQDPQASEKLQRVNFPPTQFLLKQFCILEKWDDLQECFTHSKTFEVYQSQISEWRIFLPRLKQLDKEHNWDYPDHSNDLDALRLY